MIQMELTNNWLYWAEINKLLEFIATDLSYDNSFNQVAYVYSWHQNNIKN